MKKPERPNPLDPAFRKRNAQMLDRRMSGVPYARIAWEFDLSMNRARYVIIREANRRGVALPAPKFWRRM